MDEDAADRWKSQAWTYAAVAGVATYVVALVVFLPLESTHTDAYVAGRQVVPALIGFVAGGLLGTSTQDRWRVAAPWLAPPLVAAIVILLIQGPDLWEEQKDRRESAAKYAQSHVVAPESVLAWRRVDDPALQRHVEAAADAMKERDPNASVVYGSYAQGTKAMAFIGINAGDDGNMRDELETSPREALVNYMAGSGIEDPSRVETDLEGIELMCSADAAPSTVVCSWADLTTLGTVNWVFEGVDLAQASALTEDFLGEVRIVDEAP